MCNKQNSNNVKQLWLCTYEDDFNADHVNSIGEWCSEYLDCGEYLIFDDTSIVVDDAVLHIIPGDYIESIKLY